MLLNTSCLTSNRTCWSG